MPIMTGSDQEQFQIAGGPGTFGFSGVRPDELEETEYTLATIAVDVTGSVAGFETELRGALVSAVEACQKAPRAENLLLRVILFSSMIQGGIEEIHGFKLLSQIDPTADYPDLAPGGGTPLFDAAYSAIGATESYAKILTDQEYSVNGIVFIVTDGDDNSSVVTAGSVAQKVEEIVRNEEVEGVTTVLIGVNAAYCQQELEAFQRDGKLTQYIDVGDATPSSLAKLAAFISQSVSSTSQSLGTGTPSQQLTF